MSRLIDEDFRKYCDDAKRLMKFSGKLYRDLESIATGTNDTVGGRKPGSFFTAYYQRWYSESYIFLQQVLPYRLDEFERLYQGDPKRKVINAETYAILDWLLGRRLSARRSFGEKEIDLVLKKLYQQCRIVESAKIRFESSLVDIEHIVKNDFDNIHNESTRELMKHAFNHGAGVVAKVMRHYIQILFYDQ